ERWAIVDPLDAVVVELGLVSLNEGRQVAFGRLVPDAVVHRLCAGVAQVQIGSRARALHGRAKAGALSGRDARAIQFETAVADVQRALSTVFRCDELQVGSARAGKSAESSGYEVGGIRGLSREE